MNPGSRFIDDFLFGLCTLLLLLTRLMPSVVASVLCVFSVVLIDLWPFDFVTTAATVVPSIGVTMDAEGAASIVSACSWFVSLNVRLQHGTSFAASMTADIVNWALPVELNWEREFFFWFSLMRMCISVVWQFQKPPVAICSVTHRGNVWKNGCGCECEWCVNVRKKSKMKNKLQKNRTQTPTHGRLACMRGECGTPMVMWLPCGSIWIGCGSCSWSVWTEISTASSLATVFTTRWLSLELEPDFVMADDVIEWKVWLRVPENRIQFVGRFESVAANWNKFDRTKIRRTINIAFWYCMG